MPIFIPIALVVVVLLLLVAATYVIVRQMLPQDRLYIREFAPKKTNMPPDLPKEFAQHLVEELGGIIDSHASKGLFERGEANIDVNPYREKLNIVFLQFVEDPVANGPFAGMIGLIDRIWPRYTIEGTINEYHGEVSCVAKLMYGGKMRSKWVEPEDEDQQKTAFAIAQRLAYRIIFDMLWDPDYLGDTKTGTVSLGSFYYHTRALRRWAVSREHINVNREVFNEVDGMLETAGNQDNLYALGFYNRGVLYFETHRGATTNNKALELFEQAIEKADRVMNDLDGLQEHVAMHLLGGDADSVDQATLKAITDTLQRGAKRVKGAALIGKSRCLAQNVHRYGMPEELSEEAREAANEAERIMGKLPSISYAKAFAWHCTDKLSDIRTGKQYYEEIIEQYPKTFEVVYLNLGYILMVGAQELISLPFKEAKVEAKEWFDSSIERLTVASEIAPSGSAIKKFALANLGNVYRVQGEFSRAKEIYKRAMDIDPEYINGMAELSWVSVDEGIVEEALNWHEKALQKAYENSSETHVRKIRTQFIDRLLKRNFLQPTGHDKLLYYVDELHEADVTQWVSLVQQNLSAKVAQS